MLNDLAIDNQLLSQTVFHNLKQEYYAGFSDPVIRIKNHPSKICFPLQTTEDGAFLRQVGVMMGRLSIANVCGSKTLYLNEMTGELQSTTVMYGPEGQRWQIDSAHLTRVRSGFMAALAASRFMAMTPQTRVGFIGNGLLNLATARIFNDLFGVSQFVIRGSVRCRGRNWQEFAKITDHILVDAGDKPDYLRDCDVVISCTNESFRDGLTEYEEVQGPKLFIAQDSGFQLGPSFRRETDCWSDHPEQLRDHWQYEFPWDEAPPKMIKCLAESHPWDRKKPQSIYLYGIALADLVIALFSQKYEVDFTSVSSASAKFSWR